jgi:RNA polymerase sigma-70 factor (ECF subfamily)
MDDEALVRQVVGGNKEAFRLLVLRYQRPLFRFLGLLGFAQPAAEDVAQQTFLRAFVALRDFDPARARFSTWLFTIAKRLAANEAARSHHRHEAPAGDALEGAAAPPGGAPDLSPPEPAVAAELSRRLQHALAALPAHLQSTFYLSQIRELSLQEVAVVEGCAVGTVKSRIHRAREQLRAALGDRGRSTDS